MRIVEIFDSGEGEGLQAGLPVTFLRLAGCNCNCSWCDTEFDTFTEQVVDNTYQEVTHKAEHTYNRIRITGGEPLLHFGYDDFDGGELGHLIHKLLYNSSYDVWVETNGTLPIGPLIKKIKRMSVGDDTGSRLLRLHFSVDYKLPSAEATETFFDGNIAEMSCVTDELKFVFDDEADLLAINKAYIRFRHAYGSQFTSIPKIIQPTWKLLRNFMFMESDVYSIKKLRKSTIDILYSLDINTRIGVQFHKLLDVR